MNCKLIHGDCNKEIPKLYEEGIQVDLTVTSPPYDNLRTYNNSLNWDFDIFKKVANNLYMITKEGGVVVWIVNDATIDGSETGTSFRQALYFKEIGFKLYDTMIFLKKNPIPLTHRRYEQYFEYMFVLTKGKPTTFNPIMLRSKQAGMKHCGTFYKSDDDKLTQVEPYVVKENKIKGNVFEYTVGNNGNYKHPAMFPLDLAKDHIISWSNPDDLVLDCFMGSGTTGLASLETDRNFIGIELEKKYYDIAVERCKDYQSNLEAYL